MIQLKIYRIKSIYLYFHAINYMVESKILPPDSSVIQKRFICWHKHSYLIKKNQSKQTDVWVKQIYYLSF